MILIKYKTMESILKYWFACWLIFYVFYLFNLLLENFFDFWAQTIPISDYYLIQASKVDAP